MTPTTTATLATVALALIKEMGLNGRHVFPKATPALMKNPAVLGLGAGLFVAGVAVGYCIHKNNQQKNVINNGTNNYSLFTINDSQLIVNF